MNSETEDDWAKALAVAVHDQRGYLSNIVVSLSLMKRREAYANDPKFAEILDRVENGANGLVEMASQLQLLAETGSNSDFTASGPATIGTVLQNAQRAMQRAGSAFPSIRGGDDETVLDVPPEAGGSMVAAILEAAAELGETPPVARVHSTRDETTFSVDIEKPQVQLESVEQLFDASWNSIGKPKRRSVPIGLFVARRAARKCGGELLAEKNGTGVQISLTLRHSNEKPPRDIGWG